MHYDGYVTSPNDDQHMFNGGMAMNEDGDQLLQQLGDDFGDQQPTITIDATSPVQHNFEYAIEHSATSPASTTTAADYHQQQQQIPGPSCNINWQTATKEERKDDGEAGDVQRPPRTQSAAVQRARKESLLITRDTHTPDYVIGSCDGTNVITIPSTARRYERKTSEEKQSHTYRRKRASNNDAVRKSRAKAKLRQQEIEDSVQRLETENKQLRATVKRQNSQIQTLQSTLAQLTSNSTNAPSKMKRLRK